MGKDGSVLKALLTGTALGAAFGILFAPRSGEETRDQLKDWGEQAKDSVEKGKMDLGVRARELRKEIEDLTNRTIESGQKRVQEEVDALLKAVEEGRNVLNEERKKQEDEDE